jgi:cytosine/adenosine deaminase-related metal-dependent hydrolase
MTEPSSEPDDEAAGVDRFADLEGRPVAEHVAVFDEEHSRLQRELGTIDQL